MCLGFNGLSLATFTARYLDGYHFELLGVNRKALLLCHLVIYDFEGTKLEAAYFVQHNGY